MAEISSTMGLHRIGIRPKILLFVLFPLFLLFGAIQVNDIRQTSQRAETQLVESMKNRVASNANKINTQLVQASSVAHTTRNAVSAGSLSGANTLYGMLRKNVTDHPLVFGSAIAFEPDGFEKRKRFSPYAYRKGKMIATMDIGVDGYDYTQPQWEWYATPRATRKPTWTEPYFDEGAGNIFMVTFSTPFFSGQDFAGVVTVDLDLAGLLNLSGVQQASSTPLYVVSPQGKLIFHEDAKLLGKTFENGITLSTEEKRTVADQLQHADTWLVALGKGTQRERWLIGAPIGVAGWQLVSLIDKNVVMADLQRQQLLIAIQILAIALVSAVASWWMLDRLTKPIRKLTDAAEEIARGNLSVRVGAGSADELGQLSNAFDAMAEKLAETESLLKTNVLAIGNALQRSHNFEELASALFSELAPLIHIGQASLYRVGVAEADHTDGSDFSDTAHSPDSLVLCGAYGVKDEFSPPPRIAFGDTLVGQSAIQRAPIDLKSLSSDFIPITSSLAAIRPCQLLVLPIVTNDELLGVVELLLLVPLAEIGDQLLKNLMPTLALNMQVQARTLENKAISVLHEGKPIR